MPCMKSEDEIEKQVSAPMESLGKPQQVRITAWGVHTMYGTGTAAQNVKEMERYNIKFLGSVKLDEQSKVS